MKKLTDQELDSLFKAASEGYQPAFDAAAWEAMADKLTQTKPSFWKKWMPYALAGLIIFSSGVWIGTNLKQDDKQAASKENGLIKKRDNTQENFDQPSIDRLQQGDKPMIEKNQYSQEDVVGKGSRNINTSNNEKIASYAILDTDSKGFNPASEQKRILPEQLNANEFEVLAKENLRDSTLSAKQEIQTDTTQSTSEDKKKKDTHKTLHSISLRALASPDFSAINFSSASLVGSNYAFLLEYQVSVRWTLSTGAIRSMKKYSYDKEITYSGRTADQLDGACRIIDIPLNVYYSFPSQSKISFYTGVGLSSYIMLQENYTYTVTYRSGSRSYSTQVDDKNNEWFKVLNLSAGVQYQVTPRMFLQAEPFVKTSLAGVGEGDVLLNSLGIFLGLKYKIN
jgi:opacity protein-like surface antigen